MRKIKSYIWYTKYKILKFLKIEWIIFRTVNPIDHVVDNLFIGDFRGADNKSLLHQFEITHVINCTDNTPSKYKKDFTYLELNMKDKYDQNISRGIKDSLKLIAQANRNCKVFIHCKQGVSRSGTIVIAYLMTTKRMTYEDALRYARGRRDIIRPNKSFARQLKKYGKKIKI